MDGFLNYLDDFNKKQNIIQSKKIVENVNSEQTINKSKILCMDVEIHTVEGAQKVIEKLQEWISKQEKKEHFELKESAPSLKKVIQQNKNPLKKTIKNPIQESRSHAMNILDGLPDENILTNEMVQSNININSPQIQQSNKTHKEETVTNHASSLL
jgi:hypothetical protein